MSVPSRVGKWQCYKRLEETSYVGICNVSRSHDPGNQCVRLVVKMCLVGENVQIYDLSSEVQTWGSVGTRSERSSLWVSDYDWGSHLFFVGCARSARSV